MPFKVISFDLDDTLYNNRPIMQKAESALVAYLNEQLPLKQQLDSHFWYQFKAQALAANPALFHDVTAWRRFGLVLAMQSLQLPQQNIDVWADSAMQFFLRQRSDFKLPADAIALLKSLSSRYPLVAITNGNVDVNVVGIAEYFAQVYVAGAGNLKKPDPHMFTQAISELGIKPAELLHVGDCANADIQGAQGAGCQSVWLNAKQGNFHDRLLPTIEIEKITQLSQFC